MKRRILLVIAAAIALALGMAPASAIGSRTSGNGYLGCVISGEIDQSVCLKDPTPLLPQVPRLPL